MKQINPYKMFVGSFVPNWLEVRTEISPGAKLIYARLARFAGKNGKCNPKLETLAESLGTNKRQIIRFLDELKDSKLIERKRNGLNRSNDYYFLETEWMDFSLEQSDKLSLQEGTNLSLQEGDDLSLPSNRYKENQLRESIKESTPLAPQGDGDCKNQQSPVVDPSSWHYSCSQWYCELYRARFLSYYHDRKLPSTLARPNHKKNAIVIEKLERIDGVDKERLFEILKFVLLDDEWVHGKPGFTWFLNCQSLAGLRYRSKNGLMKWENIQKSMIQNGNGKQNREEPKPAYLTNYL